MRPLMMLGLLMLVVSSTSCVRAERPVILDHTRPHQLAQDTDMYLWLRTSDGTFTKQLTHVPMDSYVWPVELLKE